MLMLKWCSQAIGKLLKNQAPLAELLPALLDPGDPRVAIRPLGNDWMCPFSGKVLQVPEWDGSSLTLLQCPKIVEHLLNLPEIQTKRLKAKMLNWEELIKRTLIRRLQFADNYKITSDRGAWVCPYCMNQTSVLFKNWDGSMSAGEWLLPELFAHLEQCPPYKQDPLSAKTKLQLQALQGEGSMRPELLRRVQTDPLYRVTDDAGNWICPFTVLPIESINLLKMPWGPQVQNIITDYLLSPQCPARYNNWQPSFSLAELNREAGKISAQRVHGQAQVAIEKELRILRSRVSDLTDTAYSAAKLKKEIKSGRMAQVKILPQHPPSIEGYEVAAFFSPCSDLGGDFYNYIDAGVGKTGIMIGDVSGHGIQAALLMTAAMKSFSIKGANLDSPRQVIVAAASDLNHDMRKGKFITVFYMILDHESGMLRYSCAGHLPALMANVNSASLYLLQGTGVAVGIGKPEQLEQRLEEYETELPRGATVLLYTDGITEAMNEANEQFGQRRLEEILFQSAGLTAEQVIEHVMAAVTAHVDKRKMGDDCTLVALKRL